MTFLEAVGLILTAVGGFASVFGLFFFRTTRYNGEATRALLRELQAETRALLERMDARAEEARKEITAAFERMDARAEETRKEIATVFERMDRRGEERHGEALQAIAALREAPRSGS